MNALFETDFQGTLGEIVVQAHLLAHGVQAAPPIKDSGNDLIAIRRQSFCAVQVRTSRDGSIDKPDPKKLYHVLAVVHLPFDGDFPMLVKARVFLFRKNDVMGLAGKVDNYPDALISDDLVLRLWPGIPVEAVDSARDPVPRFVPRKHRDSKLKR